LKTAFFDDPDVQSQYTISTVLEAYTVKIRIVVMLQAVLKEGFA